MNTTVKIPDIIAGSIKTTYGISSIKLRYEYVEIPEFRADNITVGDYIEVPSLRSENITVRGGITVGDTTITESALKELMNLLDKLNSSNTTQAECLKTQYRVLAKCGQR